MARALAGSWRAVAPPLPDDLDGERLAALAPIAVMGGAGGLLSRVLRASNVASPIADELRQCHRRQALEEALQRDKLVRLSSVLRERGVRFTLIKGLSVASRYPEPGLRPFCDHDIVVDRSDEAAARQACATLRDVEVDLHVGLPHMSASESAAALARATTVEIGGLEVPVLATEEALRLLARHALVHGVWRPVWLCDLALLAEADAGRIDWRRVPGTDRGGARAVAIALLLCREVLGASIDDAAAGTMRLPGWIVPALFAQWGAPYPEQRPLGQLPSSLRGLLEEARRRFRDPLTASAALGAWNDLPRLPVQAADLAVRTVRFLAGRPLRHD